MRVAMLNNPQTIMDPKMVGGAERMALMEIEGLARRSIEAKLFVRDEATPHPSVVPMKGMPHGADFRRYYEWFEEASRDYDVQHCHNSPLQALISKHPNVLIHLHNLAALPYYEVASPKYRRCSFAFCSDFVRGRFLQNHPDFPVDRCHAIHNGVDLSSFSPSRGRGEGGKGLRVLFAGVWLPQKGIYDFLEAIRLLQSQRSDFEAVVAGSPFLYNMGTPLQWQLEAEAQVTARVGGLKRASIVRVDYDKMPGLYRSADIFAFPSQWEEPFGISIVEAMGCALPVVATRVGGIPEIVQDGETGTLVQPSSPRSLADAIGALLDDEEARLRLGRNGRRAAEGRFSADAHVEKLIATYHGMLS